jgi:hypothetical protein
MYKWYWNAAICYTYLSDVSEDPEWEGEIEPAAGSLEDGNFKNCLPQKSLSSCKLVDIVTRVTKIEREFILDREAIRKAKIGTRFSWTASTKTTRVEDVAYCVLGIMQVDMPMLHG